MTTKPVFALLAFILSFSIHCTADENMFSSDPIGLVVSLRGKALAVNADGQERTLSIKSKVFRGDSIRTGPTARVQILFDDNTAISLGSASEMHLRDYEYRPELKQARFHTKIDQGDFQIKAGDTAKIAPDKFVTETPLGAIGIRGSMYAGSMRDGILKAMLLGGTGIYFQNAAGTVDIRTIGQGIDLPAGFTGLPVPRQFSPAEMSQMRNAANGGNSQSNASGSSEASGNSESVSESGGGAADSVSNALAAGANSGGNAVQPTFDAKAYIEKELASLALSKNNGDSNAGNMPPTNPLDPVIPPSTRPIDLLPGSTAESEYVNWQVNNNGTYSFSITTNGWRNLNYFSDISLVSGTANYQGNSHISEMNGGGVTTYIGTASLDLSLAGLRSLSGEITGQSTATTDNVRWSFSGVIPTALFTAPDSKTQFYYNGILQPSVSGYPIASGYFFGNTADNLPSSALGRVWAKMGASQFNGVWGADYVGISPMPILGAP